MNEPPAGSLSADDKPTASIALRQPTVEDGARLWQLVRHSGGLEENTCYAYLLLATHFSRTCVVAERGGELVGFVAAYVPPSKRDVIFVWQIAVDSTARRAGLARRLLQHLVSLPALDGVRYLEATVGVSNEASRRLFQAFAKTLGVPCDESDGFASELFLPQAHEAERLLRIGPLPEMH